MVQYDAQRPPFGRLVSDAMSRCGKAEKNSMLAGEELESDPVDSAAG